MENQKLMVMSFICLENRVLMNHNLKDCLQQPFTYIKARSIRYNDKERYIFKIGLHENVSKIAIIRIPCTPKR